MNIWIDCEFNDFGGDLISMGMVSEDGRTWYVSLGCDSPTPWVAENVMPVLGGNVLRLKDLQVTLQVYLSNFDACHIIADWPEDIAWFCRVLVTGPGKRIGTPPLTFEINRLLDSKKSMVPHNALADALAIKECHFELNGRRE